MAMDTELLQAARRGDLEVLRQAGERLLDALETYPYFVWAAALETDQLAVLDLCLAAGLDPNGTPEFRPLVLAIRSRAKSCCARLIDAGADLTLADEIGRSPLLAAVVLGDLDLAKSCLDAGASPFSLETDYLPVAPDIKALIQDHRKRIRSRFAAQSRAIQKMKAGATLEPLTVDQISASIPFENGATLLHLAARGNHVVSLREFLAAGADVDLRDQTPHERKYGSGTTLDLSTTFGERTPLMVACASGSLEAVNVLLEHGAQVDAADPLGDTALHLACGSGRAEVVEALLAAGANANARCQEGGTPLLVTGYFGTAQMVRALLAAGAAVDQPDEQGFTPFLAACWEGRTEVAEALLAAGADPMAHAGEEGDVWDALHIGKRTKTLRRLLPHLDPNPAGRSESPLAAAAQWHHVQAIPILIEAGARPLPGERIRIGDTFGVDSRTKIRAVRALISIGQEVDDQDLISAVWQEDLELVRILVQSGANPGSALGHASEPETADLLLDLGARIDERDADGRTALYRAVEQGRAGVVRRLLERGADPFAEDDEGIRPVDLAQLAERDVRRCFKGMHPDAARVATLRLIALLSQPIPPATRDLEDALLQGGDPNRTVGRGVPLLVAAAAWRQWEAADLLAEFGATSSWEAEIFLKVRDLPSQVGDAFAEDVTRLESVLGESAVRLEGGFGSVTFSLSAQRLAEEAAKIARGENATVVSLVAGSEVAARVGAEFRPQLKTGWCGPWRGHPIADPRLLVVPTLDPYVVVALIQPHAGEHEIGVFEILRFLREHESLGWTLTGIGYDTVDLEFASLPADLDEWARELAGFCPDLIDQGFGSRDELVEHLRKTKQLHLWWD